MLAYCRVLRVPRGVLITSGRRQSRSYMVRDGISQIDVVDVDLDGTMSDVDASVEQLAAFIRDQIT